MAIIKSFYIYDFQVKKNNVEPKVNKLRRYLLLFKVVSSGCRLTQGVYSLYLILFILLIVLIVSRL